MIISGFGFSGWTKALPSEEPQPKWTRAKNVDILRVELPRSAVELPHHWNIHVGIWLRHCILLHLPPLVEFLVLLLYPLWLVTSLLSLHSEELSKKVSLD